MCAFARYFSNLCKLSLSFSRSPLHCFWFMCSSGTVPCSRRFLMHLEWQGECPICNKVASLEPKFCFYAHKNGMQMSINSVMKYWARLQWFIWMGIYVATAHPYQCYDGFMQLCRVQINNSYESPEINMEIRLFSLAINCFHFVSMVVISALKSISLYR